MCRTQLNVSQLLFFLKLTCISWYRPFLLWCVYSWSTTCLFVPFRHKVVCLPGFNYGFSWRILMLISDCVHLWYGCILLSYEISFSSSFRCRHNWRSDFMMNFAVLCRSSSQPCSFCSRGTGSGHTSFLSASRSLHSKWSYNGGGLILEVILVW